MSQNTTVKRRALCTVPLRCLDVIGFKNEVKSLLVVELKLQRLRRIHLQLEPEQGLTL